MPSLALFGQAVSEEKIFLNSSQSETRIALGGHICWWNGTKWRAKLGIDGPWVCPFQNCVRQPHPPFKMAAVF
jgi:hypothetical protein